MNPNEAKTQSINKQRYEMTNLILANHLNRT